MRIKFRYIVCRLTSTSYRDIDISEAIHNVVRELFGLIGEGRILNRFKIIYVNEVTKLAVIRVLSTMKSKALYSMTIHKKIKGLINKHLDKLILIL